MQLVPDKIIGCTSFNNASFSHHRESGLLAWAAGCIAVVYCPTKNKQIQFLHAEDVISCLAFTPDGESLCVGYRGNKVGIQMFSISNACLKTYIPNAHATGISCIAFSPDGKYLVTAGYKADRTLHLWDWKANVSSDGIAKGLCLGSGKLSQKIFSLAFNQDGTQFVTAGEKHLKFWSMAPIFSKLASNSPEKAALTSKPAILSESGVEFEIFLDVATGRGPNSKRTYAITSLGMLCCFDEQGMQEAWVHVKAPYGFSVNVTAEVVVCAASDGIVRIFSPNSLTFRGTLPLPPAVGKANVTAIDSIPRSSPNDVYPAALAARTNEDGSTITVLYGDRSIFVWDCKDLQRPQKLRSFMSHCGPIWDIQALPPNLTGNKQSTLSNQSLFNTAMSLFATQASPFGSGTTNTVSSVLTPSNKPGLEKESPLQEKHAVATGLGPVSFWPDDTFVTVSSDCTTRLWNLSPHATLTSKELKQKKKDFLAMHKQLQEEGDTGAKARGKAEVEKVRRISSILEEPKESFNPYLRPRNIFMREQLLVLYSDNENREKRSSGTLPKANANANKEKDEKQHFGHDPKWVSGPGGTGSRLQPGSWSNRLILQTPFDPQAKRLFPGAMSTPGFSPFGLRCMAIHPEVPHIAVGDSTGNVRVFDISCPPIFQPSSAILPAPTFSLVAHHIAHDDEVTCLAYSRAPSWDVRHAHNVSNFDLLHISPPVSGTHVSSLSFDLSHPHNNQSSTLYLASASKDRLVHIFDAQVSLGNTQVPVAATLDATSSASTHYPVLSSITESTSPINGLLFLESSGQTNVSYVHNPNVSSAHVDPSAGGPSDRVGKGITENAPFIQIVTGDAGGSINFYKVMPRPNVDKENTATVDEMVYTPMLECPLIRSVAAPPGHGEIVSMITNAQERNLYTAGQNENQIHAWSLRQGCMFLRTWRHSYPNIHKITRDPTGLFITVLCKDGSVFIVDIFSGNPIAVGSGHGDAVTGSIFIPNLRRLITVSLDGCIIVWKLPAPVSSAIVDRSKEISTPLNISHLTSDVSLNQSSFHAQPPPILDHSHRPQLPSAMVPLPTASSHIPAPPQRSRSTSKPRSVQDATGVVTTSYHSSGSTAESVSTKPAIRSQQDVTEAPGHDGNDMAKEPIVHPGERAENDLVTDTEKAENIGDFENFDDALERRPDVLIGCALEPILEATLESGLESTMQFTTNNFEFKRLSDMKLQDARAQTKENKTVKPAPTESPMDKQVDVPYDDSAPFSIEELEDEEVNDTIEPVPATKLEPEEQSAKPLSSVEGAAVEEVEEDLSDLASPSPADKSRPVLQVGQAGKSAERVEEVDGPTVLKVRTSLESRDDGQWSIAELTVETHEIEEEVLSEAEEEIEDVEEDGEETVEIFPCPIDSDKLTDNCFNVSRGPNPRTDLEKEELQKKIDALRTQEAEDAVISGASSGQEEENEIVCMPKYESPVPSQVSVELACSQVESAVSAVQIDDAKVDTLNQAVKSVVGAVTSLVETFTLLSAPITEVQAEAFTNTSASSTSSEGQLSQQTSTGTPPLESPEILKRIHSLSSVLTATVTDEINNSLASSPVVSSETVQNTLKSTLMFLADMLYAIAKKPTSPNEFDNSKALPRSDTFDSLVPPRDRATSQAASITVSEIASETECDYPLDFETESEDVTKTGTIKGKNSASEKEPKRVDSFNLSLTSDLANSDEK